MKNDLGVQEIACGEIRVGTRHRQDMGDLAGLAQSIADEGLLQPIGITEDNLLVFGERRLRAIRDVLRRATIAARVVHVTSVLNGEYAENEIRKNFTPSEQVAIADAIKAAMPNRVGRPTQGKAGKEIPPNSAELSRESRDIAAEKAGLGGHTTYSEAKKVIDHGVPELVAAMDSREVSIHAASLVASLPKERQSAIVAMPPEERKKAISGVRAAQRGDVVPAPFAAPVQPPTVGGDDAPARNKRHEQINAAAKRRMMEALSSIRGYCRAVTEFDVDAIRQASTPEEIKTWADIAHNLAKELRTFGSKLAAKEQQ